MSKQFDELAKAMASGMSRREALRRFGGGLVGAVLASFGLGSAAWGQFRFSCQSFCKYECATSQGSDYTTCVKNCQYCNSGGVNLPPCCPNQAFCFGNTPCCQFPECDGIVCCSPSSCFTAGTRVVMADGSERPIERIRVGDHVLGPEGQVNRVRAIERPLLGGRGLYAMNGSKHFVTAEHPFMTSEGWRSIDPQATAAENPALPVSRLKVGDLLVAMQAAKVPVAAGRVALAEPAVPQLISVPLVSLEGSSADPGTTLYNLLLEGGHTYFANGFLVHNKD